MSLQCFRAMMVICSEILETAQGAPGFLGFCDYCHVANGQEQGPAESALASQSLRELLLVLRA